MSSRVTEVEKERMRELRAAGMSYPAIGREVWRSGNVVARVCNPEYAAAQKVSQKAYERSPERKVALKAYHQTPEYKDYQKVYHQSPEGKAAKKAYRQTPEYRASQKSYNQSSEGKAQAKSYNQTPKRKASRKAYQQSLDGKATKKVYMKAYHQSPKYKAYNQEPRRRISNSLRSRLYKAINNDQRAGSAIRDLGCTINELKTRLEALFQPGMNWDNWAFDGWHIDHIKPLASFDLADREQFKRACHYTNLQPLWAAENMSKGAAVA